jgi:hypothetical protein
LPSPTTVLVLAFCFFMDRKRQYPTCYLFSTAALFISKAESIGGPSCLACVKRREAARGRRRKAKVALVRVI